MSLLPALLFARIGQGASDLELSGAWPLQADFEVNASGLAYCDGRLLLVSDNRDLTVYRVVREGATASLAVYRELADIPEPQWPRRPWLSRLKRFLSAVLLDKRYDWEGIACDGSGNLYLASESAAAVFFVAHDGGAGRWLDAALYETGAKAGLFQLDNAFIEGIAVAPSGKSIYAAGERQPSGLIRLEAAGSAWKGSVIGIGGDSVEPPKGRSPDYAGLVLHHGELLTLERNASAVCRRGLETLEVRECWTYRLVENSARYGYRDARYGLGEGLAVAGDGLYIVFDNNGDARRADPADNRGLLLQFKLPRALQQDPERHFDHSPADSALDESASQALNTPIDASNSGR